MITLSENFRALFYTPFYAAQALGLFAQHGVTIDLRQSSEPGQAAAALQAGEVEVMWGGPLRVMLTRQADPAADVVCFCNVVARDPFFVIGRTPRPDFRPADLLDTRLATVSEVPTPWLCLQDDIRRDGADPAAVLRVTGRTMAENAAALRRAPSDGSTGRTIDAVQLFQPYAEDLLASGAGHLWYAAATRGLTAYTTFVTRQSIMKSKRQELLGMVRAMHQTLQWIRTTPGQEVQRAVASRFPDVPPTLFAAAIDRYRALELYAPDPIITREGVTRLASAMRSGGALTADIPFEAFIDNTLAEEARRAP
ncbi:MAG TPA: ABC transporter substrate-binding protein [Rhodopila sp.]|nr:ABC transporter substrate-binding protein [Rhodopila sp.]